MRFYNNVHIMNIEIFHYLLVRDIYGQIMINVRRVPLFLATKRAYLLLRWPHFPILATHGLEV